MGVSASTAPVMLGRYALYEKIASGGMASVHIARLLGPVGFARTVAIKRMHAQLAEDPEFVSMFLDEARLAARIRHPNVVPTLDVVATSGELFLVMEYVHGESLARLIRASVETGARIPPNIVAAIVVGVLDGLHAAHEAKSDQGEPLGLVHRDVSPHNVLVGTDGVARLLDFGVAKAVGRAQTTREGQLKGKLAYMAPEQIVGQVSRATDVYAASVVLWEALTAKRMFFGDHEGQVLDLVRKGCLTPPSHHVPDLPKGLDEVTMRGLSVDAAARFATARDMARALEDVLQPAMSSRVGDWVERASRDRLDARSARIASIESASANVPAQPEAEPTIANAEEMIPTQLSSGSASSSRVGPPVNRSRGRTMLVAAGGGAGGLLLAGLIALVVSGRSARPPVSATAAGATTTASAPESPPAQLASSGPGPSASQAPALSASAPPLSASSPRASGHSPVPAPTSHCTPPWSFDKRGIKVFKPECL